MPIKHRNIDRSCVSLSTLLVCLPSFFLAQGDVVSARENRGRVAAELKPLVIERKAEPSNRRKVLTMQDIDQKQVDDVRDINRSTPFVTYNSRNDSFVVRGLDSHRVQTTLDGIPLSWLDDGVRDLKGGSSLFDFGALSRFGIVYGSGALGGIVDLRTLNPEDLITKGHNEGGLVRGSYRSVDSSWRLDQAFAMRSDQISFLFQASHVIGHERKNMGTIGGTGGRRTRANPSDYDQNNLLLKLYKYIDGRHKLGLTAERFGYDKVTHSLNASSTTYLPGSVYDTKTLYRERLSLSYDYSGNKESALDALHGQIYWQKQSNNQVLDAYRIKLPSGDYLRDNLMRYTNYGLDVWGLKGLDIGSVNHSLKFSANVLASQFHQYAAGKDNCHRPENVRGCVFLHTNQSDAPDTDSYALGLSVEDKIHFSEQHLRLIPGVRYDWYRHDPRKTPAYRKVGNFEKEPLRRNNGARFSPKLRVEWDVRDQLTFYAQWAQAFRAPSVPELYVAFVSPGYYYMLGNPDLKPETKNEYDIGFKYGNDRFGGFINAFVSQYKNFIDVLKEKPSQEFTIYRGRYVNRSNVRISGVDMGAHWASSNGLRGRFALSYAHGKDLDKKEYLDSIPALRAVIGLGYEMKTWGADVALNLAAKHDKVASNSRKTPGYKVVDVSAWWKPLGEKGPIIRAGVYNLFDEKYWNVADLPPDSPRGPTSLPRDYFSQPGRNFKVSFVQKF